MRMRMMMMIVLMVPQVEMKDDVLHRTARYLLSMKNEFVIAIVIVIVFVSERKK